MPSPNAPAPPDLVLFDGLAFVRLFPGLPALPHRQASDANGGDGVGRHEGHDTPNAGVEITGPPLDS